ncbi:MAG: hypothetical protein B7Z45_08290, partial [Azorhizobium sp. 12-66-6]
MARFFSFFALLAALAGAWPWMAPALKGGVHLVLARNDPAALADLALARFTPAQAQAAITSALAADDAELAASTLALADARGLEIPPDLRARVTATGATGAAAWRMARGFTQGFVTGVPEDAAGLAGTLAGDLTAWGDVRDLTRESWTYANGGDPDTLILGLSAAGLALTAGTYATFGAGLPVRAGVTLVKAAKRAGSLSVDLGQSLARAVRHSFDVPALRKAVASADGPGLRAAVNADGLKPLGRLLGDVGTVQGKAGARTALTGLAVAEDGRDLARLARLAERKGDQTLAILKILGRGALTITGAVLYLLWWGAGGVIWLFGMIA